MLAARRPLLFVLLATASLAGRAPAGDAPAPVAPSVTIEGDIDAALAPVAGRLTSLFFESYPKLLKRFDDPARPAPRAVRIVFRAELAAPAQCSGNTVEVSVEWLRKHPDDAALIVHELTHAVQAYPAPPAPGAPAAGGAGAEVPGWMVEGIADYARQEYGPRVQKGWSLPKKLTAKQSYRDSYRTSARFLAWLEARTPGSVDKLHRRLQEGKYTDADFQAVAGRPLDALWDECVAELGK